MTVGTALNNIHTKQVNVSSPAHQSAAIVAAAERGERGRGRDKGGGVFFFHFFFSHFFPPQGSVEANEPEDQKGFCWVKDRSCSVDDKRLDGFTQGPRWEQRPRG